VYCTITSLVALLGSPQSTVLALHVRLAGFGVQLPLTDIPSDVQFALIVPGGTNPGSHMKDITAPTSVLEIFPMKPFRGAVGNPQLTTEQLKALGFGVHPLLVQFAINLVSGTRSGSQL